MGNRLGRAFTFLLVGAALAWSAPRAHAQDGDAFLIVSFDPQFDTTVGYNGEFFDYGSDVIIVRIGSLAGGVPSPDATHFVPEDPPPPVPLPTDEFSLDSLDGNPCTIFGSFEVDAFDGSTEAHMLTPGLTLIDPAIQAAVLMASADIAAAADENPFMTTGEIAQIVADYLPEESNITLSDIAKALFGDSEPMGVSMPTEDTFSCEAEGDLLPHQPGESANSHFEFAFDQDGTFSSLMICLLVDAEVKEKSVNLKKKGAVSIAIYASDALNTDDIDDMTVEIDGVYATKVQYAAKKATCQFNVQDLVDGGALDSSTTEITIHATLTDGSCIESTIPINVK
jgi:hypothetical protein